MAEKTSQKSGPSGPYRHLIDGEAYGKPHQAGDRVDSSVPAAKLKEWLKAGVIKKEKR